MTHEAVIGLQFGDEGKGRVVDQLCKLAGDPSDTLVVRFSGGQQAGHHVVLPNGVDHVFSSFGSGTLRGCPTYISPFCTVDPVGILNELSVLNGKGAPKPKLYIDAKCPITTPYDKAHNKSADNFNRHGSCRVGVGATWEREEKMYSLLAEDLFHPGILDMKLFQIAKYYHNTAEPFEFIKRCLDLVSSGNVEVVSEGRIPSPCENVIFEGSQGLLLDKNIGFFPHVTRSNTGLKNVLEIVSSLDKVHYVTRAYQTRHGNGPMTNEQVPHAIKPNPYEQNLNNDRQGRFRVTPLDLDLLKYALKKDEYTSANKSLTITCLDLIKDFYYFTLNGHLISSDNEEDFVNAIADTLRIGDVRLSRSVNCPIFGRKVENVEKLAT